MLPIDMLYGAAARTPDAVAVETPDVRLSYAELVARVDALAAGLQSLDASPGSRVGICGHNTVEHLLALLATMAAEKIWIPLNARDAGDELDLKLEAARPSIVVVDEDCLGKLTADVGRRVIGRGGGAGAGDSVAGLIAAGVGLASSVAKKAVAGHGGASKEMVRDLVVEQLHLDQVPEPNDATDALALALCLLFDPDLDPRFGAAQEGQA